MAIWDEVVREIERYTRNIRDLRVSSVESPAALRAEIASTFGFDSPVPLEELTRRVAALFRAHTIHVTHPRYFGLFNPSIRTAGIVADALAALYNPQLAAWSHSPAANELERATLRYLTSAVGLDPDGTSANFTTGGAEANMSAVLAALAHRFPDTARDGVRALPGLPVVYVTSESHHSFVKIARMAGLGTSVLAEVPVAEDFRLDIDALADRMRADVRDGRLPFLVVGTAGTTGGGFVDPLDEIAALAAEYGAWFHVDAAWGGAAALVPRLRPALGGIERADSVTWDAHKWLSVPMGAGMFFCRHADAVRRAFGLTASSYMPSPAGEDTVDPYATTMQWSRRAIGLKVFMTIAELGAAGLSEMIDRQALLGDRLRDRLRLAGWPVVNATPLPLVCFTHSDLMSGRLTPTTLLERLYRRGRVWISEVTLGGRVRALRACITSFRTTEDDLECLVAELELARTEAS